ncbi:unnamed protein product, partial [Didymodactylos carnosus]
MSVTVTDGAGIPTSGWG